MYTCFKTVSQIRTAGYPKKSINIARFKNIVFFAPFVEACNIFHCGELILYRTGHTTVQRERVKISHSLVWMEVNLLCRTIGNRRLRKREFLTHRRSASVAFYSPPPVKYVEDVFA